MRILKRMVIGILILVAVLLVTALFVPRKSASEGQITINKPASLVFDYVKFVKNQDNFGVWQLSDPEMIKTSEGTDGTVGFIYKWDSKKLGKGAQKITNIIDGQRIETEMYFYDFNEDPHPAYIEVTELSPSTSSVKWGINWTTPYPFNIMNLFNNMNKTFVEGLNNLKVILEEDQKAQQ